MPWGSVTPAVLMTIPPMVLAREIFSQPVRFVLSL